MEILNIPWPWYLSGLLISATMFVLLKFGKSFGVSSNLRSLCSIAGAGSHVAFFDFDWKKQIWNLVFLLGVVLGGVLAIMALGSDYAIDISQNTIQKLEALGFSNVGESLAPSELYGMDIFKSIPIIVFLLIGGIFVGFGTRYAGGCTSGHAITGLSHLQVPSLIAVIGFFIGGLIMTHLILPIILPIIL